ncbi:nonstructural protein [Ambe virus]|uniref:Nonstructural protein n=1 Tax=Ambe virus TaxID=1926500 RepID=A0A1S5SHT9_9VIRU|nr:nonstructural protein [Ambe virus]API68874.1 nonstructural protein [Ambe virus]
MNKFYLYDKMSIIRPGGLYCSLPRVTFEAFNAYQENPISRYSDIEFPLPAGFRVSSKTRATLSDYYMNREFPMHWGCSQQSYALAPYITVFDEMIECLSHFKEHEISAECHPNLHEALSWPTGGPNLDYMRFYSNKPDCMYERKCREATLILRASRPNWWFAESLYNSHKNAFHESVVRGLDPRFFNGSDVIKEICIVQCVRLLNAVLFDGIYSRVPNKFYMAVEYFRNKLEHLGPAILGNRKWIPHVNTRFDLLNKCIDEEFCTDSVYESDLDLAKEFEDILKDVTEL